jgi:hypothetical protein
VTSPVQQASEQQIVAAASPVQQASGQQIVAAASPVHQASTWTSPVHQAPPREILQDLPGLPQPVEQLQIEPPEEQGRVTSLSTPEPEAQRLLLPAAGESAATQPTTPVKDDQHQLIVPPSQEITLPDAPAKQISTGESQQQALIPISKELTITDTPAETQIALPISKEVTFTEAPRLHSPEPGFDLAQFEVERNYWGESPPSVPGLVKKFENLLVDLDSPNQWNTEHSGTARASSSTYSTSSEHSSESSTHRMSPSGKQPQKPEAADPPHRQSEAGSSRPRPTWEPIRTAGAGPSRMAWEPTGHNASADPAEFFKPRNTFTTYGCNAGRYITRTQ